MVQGRFAHYRYLQVKDPVQEVSTRSCYVRTVPWPIYASFPLRRLELPGAVAFRRIVANLTRPETGCLLSRVATLNTRDLYSYNRAVRFDCNKKSCSRTTTDTDADADLLPLLIGVKDFKAAI